MARKPQKGRNQGRQDFQKEYKQRAKEKQNESAKSPIVKVSHEPRTEDQRRQTTPMTASSDGAQTMQQQRAKYALEQVDAALQGGANRKEFKSYAASFPAMIQMNGLGQAAACYFSQGDTYRRLYDILSGWLTQETQPYAGQSDLLAGITGKDMHSYRIAQVEALLLLDWVKRFAKAFVRED